jgi:hypothetical protein
MSNPYESPPTIESERRVVSTIRRPLGVSIAAIIVALPGILIGVILIAMIVLSPGELSQFSINLKAGVVTILAIIFPLGVVAGTGMWFQQKWAWIGTQLYCLWHVYSGFRGWTVHSINPGIVGAIFLGIHIAITIYLYFEGPRNYFSVGYRKACLSTFGVCVGTIALYHASTWVWPLLELILRRSSFTTGWSIFFSAG